MGWWATGLNAVLGRQSLGLGTAALRNAEDTLTNGSNLPDGAAIISYINGRGFITDPNDSVQPSELDGTFSTVGLLKRLGAGSYTTVPDIRRTGIRHSAGAITPLKDT
jgi:hypothetical protein